MTRRSGEKVLADLLDSSDAGAELVARGRTAFDQDRLLRLAGEAVVGRIGEAARKLLAEFGEDLPQDIPWSDVVGARISSTTRTTGSTTTSSGRPLNETSPQWRVPSAAGQPNATSRSSGSSSQPEIDPEVWAASRRANLNSSDLIPATVVGAGVAIEKMRPYCVFGALSVPGGQGWRLQSPRLGGARRANRGRRPKPIVGRVGSEGLRARHANV